MEDKAKTSIEDSLRGERLMEARSASYYNTAQKSKDSTDTDYSSSEEITQQKWTDGLQDSNFRNLNKEKRKSVKNRIMNGSGVPRLTLSLAAYVGELPTTLPFD